MRFSALTSCGGCVEAVEEFARAGHGKAGNGRVGEFVYGTGQADNITTEGKRSSSLVTVRSSIFVRTGRSGE